MANEENGSWYPTRKTKSQSCCFRHPLDLIESDQIQEWWIIDGSVGLDVMEWRDGLFANWEPVCGDSMERARRKCPTPADV